MCQGEFMSGIMKTMSNLSEAANEALVEYNKEVRKNTYR